MSKVPKKRTPEFKLKLDVEALKGERTLVQIASEHGIHPKQIRRWRDQLLEEAEEIFIHKSTQKRADPDKECVDKQLWATPSLRRPRNPEDEHE